MPYLVPDVVKPWEQKCFDSDITHSMCLDRSGRCEVYQLCTKCVDEAVEWSVQD